MCREDKSSRNQAGLLSTLRAHVFDVLGDDTPDILRGCPGVPPARPVKRNDVTDASEPARTRVQPCDVTGSLRMRLRIFFN
jgi:hypothetical protein